MAGDDATPHSFDAAKLHRAIVDGDRAALLELRKMICKRATQLLRGKYIGLVDDAVSATQIRIIKALCENKGPSIGVAKWIGTITTRATIDVVNAAQRQDHDELEEEAPAPSSHVEKSAVHVLSEPMLARLSPLHRSLVLLVYRDGYRLTDAAKLLGINGQTAKSRLHRARRALQTMVLLGENDPTGTER